MLRIWLDPSGRLIEARTTVTERVPSDTRSSALPKELSGTSTTTSTVWLDDFGAPVHIAAPHVNARSGYSSSTVLVTASGKGCPGFGASLRGWISVSSGS